MKNYLFFFSVILLGLLMAGLFLYCTPEGVGLTNDSASYIGGARSILAGQGYSRIGGDHQPRPITHFPPLYSLVLAGAAKLSGLDPLKAANWVNLVGAVLNQVLVMLALRMLCGSNFCAFLGGAAFLCAGPVLHGHIYGLSETLYLTLFFVIFILSVKAGRDSAVGVWFAVGLLSGLLMLTRYAGAAVIAALAIYVLCVMPGFKRMKALGLLIVGFALPFSAWLAYSSRQGEGSPVNRVLALHWPAADKIEEGIRNFAGFFLPEYGGLVDRFLNIWSAVIPALLLLVLLVVAIRVCFGLQHYSKTLAQDPLFPPALQGIAYMLMLVANVCLLDGSTLFDDRILLPFYVCALLLIYSAGAQLIQRGKPLLSVLTVLCLVGWCAVLFEDEWDLIREYHRNGQGFAGSEWTYSETKVEAKMLPQEKLFFSNRQTYLTLMNDQPSYILPPMFDAANFSERDSFEADRQWMASEVLSGNAYVIVFNYQDMMADEGDREWLELVLQDLPLYGEYSDGAIFGLLPEQTGI